jgi:hypothetical protein
MEPRILPQTAASAIRGSSPDGGHAISFPMPRDLPTAAVLLAAVWMLAAFSRAPVRRALLNGLRCLARYSALWRVPAICAFGYVTFQFAASALLHARLGEMPPLIAASPAPTLGELAAAAGLPAAERTAAGFSVFTATFPFSAWAALLFLVNFGGLLRELFRALHQRFGKFRGPALAVALWICALAALIKPAVYLLLPEILARAPLAVPMTVNALSSAFELLLGIFLLTDLMLMSHAWLRGLRFERRKLRLVAMRRTGYVLKWSLVLLAATALLVILPIYVGLFFAPGEPFYEGCAWFSACVGRPAVTTLALLYCPVQAILVFHNESLRAALRDGRQLLTRHWSIMLPFLLLAFTSFFILQAALETAVFRVGSETAAGFGMHLLGAGAEAFLIGWFIASWVCLYKGFSPGRKEVLF